MVACGTAHQEATLCFDTHRASPYLLFFFIFSSAMHALGDILRAHRNEGASTSLGVSYIACRMVLLYRFHDMDSMRDPHIYCNQHSDQNMACVINMVGCHGQQQLKIMRDSDLFPLFGRRHTTCLVSPLIAEGYIRLHK